MLPPLSNAVVVWFSSISWLPEPVGFTLGIAVNVGAWLLIAWLAAKLHNMKISDQANA